MRGMKAFIKTFVVVIALCANTGLSQANEHQYVSTYDAPYCDPDVTTEELLDPFESCNRVVFEINQGLDIILFRPVSKLYSTFIPMPVQLAVSNIVYNLSGPLTFVHEFLQGNPRNAAEVFFRFLVNSTIGLGGFMDVASVMGIPHHKQDMGKTLSSYGASNGFYLVLPVLGSSTIRDAVGLATDMFINPVRIVFTNNDLDAVHYGVGGTAAVDARKNADALIERINQSPDPYKQYRQLYLQRRNYSTSQSMEEASDLPGAE